MKISRIIKKNIYLILVLILILILVYFNNSEGFIDNTPYDIVIIAGQSNAQGTGSEYYTPQKNRMDEPLYNDPYFNEDKNNTSYPSASDRLRQRIKAFNARNEIVVAVDPLRHFPETGIKENRNGFGISFARQYVKEKNKNVMLLGCAMGTTAFNFFPLGMPPQYSSL